jgi:hypothetical protein
MPLQGGALSPLGLPIRIWLSFPPIVQPKPLSRILTDEFLKIIHQAGGIRLNILLEIAGPIKINPWRDMHMVSVIRLADI